MIKLLIVDDEPLVLAGLKSMVNWEDLNIDIISTAANGSQAYEIISLRKPDIVLSDIKMPLLSGIELAEKCRNQLNNPPLFIFLTSFEEISYLRKAIKLQAVDYLIKLELNEKNLIDSINKAKQKLERNRYGRNYSEIGTSNILKESFFIRLFNNILKSETEDILRERSLKHGFKGTFFSVTAVRLIGGENDNVQLISSMQIIEETAGRYCSLISVPLSVDLFVLLVGIENIKEELAQEKIKNILTGSISHVDKYFNIKLICGMGEVQRELKKIPLSYRQSQKALVVHSNTPGIELYNGQEQGEKISTYEEFGNAFRMSLTTGDHEKSTEILDSLIGALNVGIPMFSRCLDTSCSVMFEVLGTLDKGEELLDSFFEEIESGYRCLFETYTPEQTIQWLERVKEGLSEYLSHNTRNNSEILSDQIKTFLKSHYRENLELRDIASYFNMSPNYLCTIFNKNNSMGIPGYQNLLKIRKAQELLKSGNYKNYEISEMTGFDSPYYFSKVFKKITGESPSSWQLKNRENPIKV